VIIKPHILFPYYWTDDRPEKFGNAWAAHHWARSWWTQQMWTDLERAKANPLNT
jgi:hypothetical protein